MKLPNLKSAGFPKFEFWAATTVFVFVLFFFVSEAVHTNNQVVAPNKFLFENAGAPFYFLGHYFLPMLARYFFMYGAFLYCNFLVIPRLLKKESAFRNAIILILLYIAAVLVFYLTDLLLKNYLFHEYPATEVYNRILENSFLYATWLVMLLVFYTLIKYFSLYLYSNSTSHHAKHVFITTNGLAAFWLWVLSMFICVIAGVDGDVIAGWGVIGPSGIFLYWLAFYSLIPHSLRKRKSFLNYLGRCLLILAVSFLPVMLILLMLLRDEDAASGLAVFNTVLQLLITVPLSWWLFKKQSKGKEELFHLKKELGQTHASFDFLRSQINPHFLFNALNTLYGTALQEGAERTGEGIENLGSMMRFMLQENMQEKISLEREVEYLTNYIALQKLRTDPSPTVRIMATIAEEVNGIQVAPMLFIPFIENAFKHGISFREPSYINISLEVKQHIIYFDVHNSKHNRIGTDPEADKTGIGLNNVKQRLQLLYEDKHELVIRETPRDFFVHLTLHTR